MLIVNADDWGRSRAETDAALSCYQAGGITSTTAMMFMEDSERAAALAQECRIVVGLHLNLSQKFTALAPGAAVLGDYHERICRFLKSSRFAFLFYHPLLRGQFRYVYRAQVDEFQRLYGRPPSHVDGHQHLHLCSNMLLDQIIPAGTKVRRNFTFLPGEKPALNRAYRQFSDGRLGRRYRLTDYFFSMSQHLSLEQFARVAQLSRSANVEVAAHPGRPAELDFLTSAPYLTLLKELPTGSFGQL